MIAITRFATFVALALTAIASPVVTIPEPVARLPLTKHVDSLNFAANDRARIEYLFSHINSNTRPAFSARDVTAQSASLTNQGNGYTATIGIGDPAQMFDVTVDTGSANTWVGAKTRYEPTSSSHKTGMNLTLPYIIGSASATVYEDKVALGDLTVPQQTIGVATETQNLSRYDGILGIGPTILTTVTNPNHTQIPTFTDNLYHQNTIPNNSIAISFEPWANETTSNGELTFGGVDPSKYTGKITYTPRVTSGPASVYWGMNQSITYGNESSTILINGAGVVDTGTTFIYLATDAYDQYKKASNAQFDNASQLHYMSATQYHSLKSLYFKIAGRPFELTSNAQLLPRQLNFSGSPDTDRYYLAVNDIALFGTPGKAPAIDFLLGYTFMERFYTVFDTTHDRIGFATTPYTNVNTN